MHLKVSLSSTQTVESCVAATVAPLGLLYMRLTSPKQSPLFFMFTLKFTPCRRSNTWQNIPAVSHSVS